MTFFLRSGHRWRDLRCQSTVGIPYTLPITIPIRQKPLPSRLTLPHREFAQVFRFEIAVSCRTSVSLPILFVRASSRARAIPGLAAEGSLKLEGSTCHLITLLTKVRVHPFVLKTSALTNYFAVLTISTHQLGRERVNFIQITAQSMSPVRDNFAGGV